MPKKYPGLKGAIKGLFNREKVTVPCFALFLKGVFRFGNVRL